MPQLTPPIITLPPNINAIDIWKVSIDTLPIDITSLIDLLDNLERERYQHLHKNHQLTYLVSHAACRQILAKYLTVPAEQIKYKKNQYGKPLLDHETSIHFNMSHSHYYALIAVSNHSEIGVDIEYIEKKTSWEKIARRFFHDKEIAFLFDSDPSKQKSIFFQIWTRKEAYIKALGTGFSTPFSSFNVTEENITNDTNTIIWYQKNLELSSQYFAAVTQNTPIEKIRYHSY